MCCLREVSSRGREALGEIYLKAYKITLFNPYGLKSVGSMRLDNGGYSGEWADLYRI